MSRQIEPPFYIALCTYLSYTLLYVVGNIWDFVELNVLRLTPPCDKPGYAPIRIPREDFYTRRVFNRISDCFNRPIASAPDNHIDVMERTHPHADQKLKVTGRCQRCVNIGSYNYLGFAAADPFCTPLVLDALKNHSPSMCSPRMEAGTCPAHQELEEELAQFLGKEASMVYGMGYATNSANIPALAGPGCLIISDSLNHSSIVAGTRGSGAKVIRFRHNDTVHLEALLRECIAEGQPRTHRPWKKVLIVVEGIYSMEGEVCRLKEIVEIKKKYKAYLYVDEAHSIGALGASGRGVTEHCGVDPKDVDVLMGTFTKSFGSCGGYLAGDAGLIQYLRLRSPAHLFATSMSPAAVKQVTAALRLMRGEDGTDRGAQKIRTLHSNSNYMRKQLEEMGVEVLGDGDSPVMPIMVYCPCKVAAFSRIAFQRGVAAVVVGFPATPLLLARARICISAAHTKEDLDYTLKVIREVSDLICLQADTSVATMFTSLLSWLTLPSIASLLAARTTTCGHAPRAPAAAPAAKQKTSQLQSPPQQQKKPPQQQNGTRLRRAPQRSGPTTRVVQALSTGPVTRSSAAARA